MKTLMLAAAMAAGISSVNGQQIETPTSQQETLDRGIVVVPMEKGGGMFVSWRMLGTDGYSTTFDVVRDGEVIAKGLDSRTNYVDRGGKPTSSYSIMTKRPDGPNEASLLVTPWDKSYLSLPLDRPQGGSGYSYVPNDCSVGDVDGDGQYEIIVKWDPTNSQDNSKNGNTANVLLDCYRLDGTKLWRIDLGYNIRAGAHYTQFLVYDFDGDGMAEMICKTAPGSKDATGEYVNKAATDAAVKNVSNSRDFTNNNGHIITGQEFLTVFDGATGKAVHTVWYNPNRAGTFNKVGNHPASSTYWGDNYGGRSERYLACVAYLDGHDANPTAVMCRGYYTRAYLWAVDFDGKELKTRWLHASTDKQTVELYGPDLVEKTKTTHTENTAGTTWSYTMFANGNHNLAVGDVDADGKDEILFGSAAVDDNGALLYATGYGHGDAIHLGDLDPTRPGLELFQVHEESATGYGWDLHDAATGEILYSSSGSTDNGRGLAADIDAASYGAEFWSSNDRKPRSAVSGQTVIDKHCSVNFRVYWDGDLQDELYDNSSVTKWNGTKFTQIADLAALGHSHDCNSTKHSPNLQADILGDWREEIVLYDSTDCAHLNIITTTAESNFRMPTLMHDHTYRMAVACQNAGYNQPPHLGYYLPARFASRLVAVKGAMEQTVAKGADMEPVVCRWENCTAAVFEKMVAPDGSEKEGAAIVDGFEYAVCGDEGKNFALKGSPDQLGTYAFVFRLDGNVVDGTTSRDTVFVHCVEQTGIENVGVGYGSPWVEASLTADGTIALDFNVTDSRRVEVTVANAAGMAVGSATFSVAGTDRVRLDNMAVGRGVYLVRVKSHQGVYCKKIAID